MSTARVLVADDSLSVRKVVERALASRRIETITVASGAEALERIEREAPDVVVCDVVMPDRDGWEICGFVKGHARLAGTPVLLMTGVVDDTVRARAREAGAAGVLAKPFGADDLLRRLEALLPPGREDGPATPAPAETGPAPALPVSGDGPDESAGVGLSAHLGRLTEVEGVLWAVLADRDGFVLEAVTADGVDVEAVAAVCARVVALSRALGGELGRGALLGTLLEYEAGLVVVHEVATTASLAIGVHGPAALGKVRYAVKKSLPGLARAV